SSARATSRRSDPRRAPLGYLDTARDGAPRVVMSNNLAFGASTARPCSAARRTEPQSDRRGSHTVMKILLVYPRFERFLGAYPDLAAIPTIGGLWRYRMPPRSARRSSPR
ncbi:MAG: hypothetical protein M5U28_11185, partial [Sandaracinaceae bacterium]|nr:hypothetical protein [Sandaracinaceae bacterium]